MHYLRFRFILVALLIALAGYEIGGGGLLGHLFGRTWLADLLWRTTDATLRDTTDQPHLAPVIDRPRDSIRDAHVTVSLSEGKESGRRGNVTLTQLLALHGNGPTNLTYRIVHQHLHPGLERIARATGSGQIDMDVIGMLNAKREPLLLLNLSLYPGSRDKLQFIYTDSDGRPITGTDQTPIRATIVYPGPAAREGIFLIPDRRTVTGRYIAQREWKTGDVQIGGIRVQGPDREIISQASLDPRRHELYAAQAAALDTPPPAPAGTSSTSSPGSWSKDGRQIPQRNSPF